MYLNLLEKHEQAKPKISRSKDVTTMGGLIKWRLREQHKRSMKQRVGSLKHKQDWQT
jgi:hypothetical protein